MSCSCIANNNFNFIIEYKKDYILFIDKSEWVTPEYNTPLTTHTLKIINGNKEKQITFTIGGSTIIKYCDLPSSGECGPDGIYTFEVESCGEIFSRCEAILQHITCSYNKLLVQIPVEEYKEKALPVFTLMEYIKSNARVCNITEASKNYELIEKVLKKLNCKC